jgi:lipopolysaccharide transport system permease protein
MEASAQTRNEHARIRVIEPGTKFPLPDLRELWERRDLLYFLARRDVAVKYRQSTLGPFWAVLEPLLLAGVFSVFFGLLQKVDPPKGIPYPLFAASGMVLWIYFSNALSSVASSTVGSPELISKVYFPRIIIPLAAVVPAVVGFAAGFAVVIVLTLAYGFVPGPEVLLMPVLALFVAVLALGIGLWLSAINVRYRDVYMLVPFLILIGLFASPIIYPLDLLPDHLETLYAINPVVGLLEAYRWMLLGTEWPGVLLIPSVVIGPLLVLTGAIYFQRAEQSFADVI